MWNTKLAYAVGVLVVTVAFTVLTFELDAWTAPGQPGPALFPRALGITLVVISAVNLVLDVISEREQQRHPAVVAQSAGATKQEDAVGEPQQDGGQLKQDAGEREQPAGPPAVNPRMVLYQISLAVAFILLFEPLGAMVSVVLFGVASVFLLIRRERVKTASVVVATSVGLVLLTQVVLQQNLPTGIFGDFILLS